MERPLVGKINASLTNTYAPSVDFNVTGGQDALPMPWDSHLIAAALTSSAVLKAGSLPRFRT